LKIQIFSEQSKLGVFENFQGNIFEFGRLQRQLSEENLIQNAP
jgi:hypothetical protein